MGASLRVLIAEDDPTVQDQLAQVLRTNGFDVCAYSGAAASASLEREPYVLAVVSLDLALVDPLFLIRRAKDRSIPCLVVGASFYDHEAREACQLGADSVWVRPLDDDRFLERVRSVLTSSSPTEESLLLLIDDTDETRRAIRRMLERGGFRVLEAARGVEGIRLASTHRVDLIVLDVNLPGIDGLSVCEILKSEAATCRIPVLVCTVRFEDEDQLRAAAAGADGFLGKPFSSERLIESVQKLLPARSVAEKS